MIYFECEEIYHVYNRSFRHTALFKSHHNYFYFVNKVAQLNSIVNILAYCLMPDHYHLLIHIPQNSEAVNSLGQNDETGQTAQSGPTGRGSQLKSMQVLARRIGTIQSSFSQAMNKMTGTTGSWFQPKAKAKRLEGEHVFNCFHYIHQNPFKAGLVKRIEDWNYSSFNEYLRSESTVCNLAVGRRLIDIPRDRELFKSQSYAVVSNFDFTKGYE